MDQRARLEQWLGLGGTIRVEGDDTVVLCRCDGPEVERFAAGDPDLLAWANDHADPYHEPAAGPR